MERQGMVLASVPGLTSQRVHWETPDSTRREQNPGSQLCSGAGAGLDTSRHSERLRWREQQHSMSTAAAGIWCSGKVPAHVRG